MADLPRIDLAPTPLVLGANPFGWTVDTAGSFAILDAFVGGGGRMIDTADGYSYWADGNAGGESERIIGAWLADRGLRDEVLIATKVSRHPEFIGLSATNVRAAALASLDRLGVDVIDVYYAHYDDPEVPIEESVAAFDALIDDGIVREVGLSNYTPERILAWIAAAERGGHRAPRFLQPHYNLVHRAEFEARIQPIAESAGLAVTPYFALASGLLTGKYRSRQELAASPRARFLLTYDSDVTFLVVDEVLRIADELRLTPAAVALAWVRDRPTVAGPIASASSADQVTGLLAGARAELPAEAVARLDSVSAPAATTIDERTAS